MKRNCPLARRAALRRVGDIAPELHVVELALDPEQRLGQLASEKSRDPLASPRRPAAGRRRPWSPSDTSSELPGCASAIRENMSATWPLSVMSDLRNVRRTGMLWKRLRTSITVPGEQPHFLIGPKTPASITSSDPSAVAGLTCLAADLGHLGDRRQRLAAKPERPDPEQVVGLGQLAGGVRLKRQNQIIGGHPQPVVGDPDQVFAPALDRQVDPRGPGVDRVFEQLLDHARRPLDNLAGGDLIDDRLQATGG